MACAGYPPRIPVRAVATSSSNRLRGVAAARSLPAKVWRTGGKVQFSSGERASIGTGASGLAGHALPAPATLR